MPSVIAHCVFDYIFSGSVRVSESLWQLDGTVHNDAAFLIVILLVTRIRKYVKHIRSFVLDRPSRPGNFYTL
jgi:hypothetical protein